MHFQNNKNNTLTLQQKKSLLVKRRLFKKPVIGVSGYLGKTTLVEMLAHILEIKGSVLKTPWGSGSWKNNLHTLEKLDGQSYDFAIFEVDYIGGRNFAGLLRLIKPNYCVVTNIGDAHLSYLKEAARLALQRSEVINFLERNGIAFLNHDDEFSSLLVKYIHNGSCKKYGLNQNADFFASDIKHYGPQGIEFYINNDKYKKKLKLPIYSTMTVYNVLAAIAVAQNLGFSINEIEKRLKDFKIPKGRGTLEKINSIYLIDESFFGTSRSISKAARSLVGFKLFSKKLILIVGDMTETGTKVEDRHLNMGYFLSALPIDYIITVGHYAQYIAQGASLISSKERKIISVKTIDQLIRKLSPLLQPNYTVTVKGLGNVAYHRIKKLIQRKQFKEGIK